MILLSAPGMTRLQHRLYGSFWKAKSVHLKPNLNNKICKELFAQITEPNITLLICATRILIII
jgi:hypothetical protein